MKILFVYERKIVPEAGGVERVTTLLASEMARRGHSVAFLSVGPQKWNAGSAPDSGFQQFYIPSDSPNFAPRLMELVEKEGYDAAIVQGTHPSVLPVLPLLKGKLARLIVFHNRPYPLSPHERFIKRLTPWSSLRLKGKIVKCLALCAPSVFRHLNNRQLRRRYRYLAANVERVVFLSVKFIPRFLRLTPGIEEEKLAGINNPNTFEVTQGRQDAQKENLVVFVSRLSNPQKNVTGFIDVWKEFSRSHPEWKAVVIGDGEHRKAIERYALKKKVDNLQFAGSRKDVEEFYRRAKLLCMTSAYEGWGMVLTEAMAYGCVPLVFDSYEAASDIIISGENGVLVAPFDVRAMAEAMGAIAADENLRMDMADKGRKSVERFDVKTIVSEWERILADSRLSGSKSIQ